MTIHKALNQLEWKISNHWKITEVDIEAYNTIVEFVDKQQKQQFNNNQLFAKLYITFYGELLKFYEGTVFDKEPQKALHRILDTPIEQIIEKFIGKHQDIEHAIQIPKEERYKHPLILNKDKFDLVDKLDYNETKDNLTAMINMALNKYK